MDLVPGLHPLRFKDLPISKSDSVEALLQLLSIVYNKTSLENLALSELQHYHQIPFFSTGSLFKISSPSNTSLLEENINCISWLDKQALNSVLYISLGNLASVNETKLAKMAWGLANSGQPFLWVIRPGSIHRGCIVKCAPQKEVLAHSGVGGFWSYCRCNSVLESVSEGVLMISLLCFGDQKVNVRYVSSLRKSRTSEGWIGDRESGEKVYGRERIGEDEAESY
ncbi:unnamed protein product [Camellia sinensis]